MSASPLPLPGRALRAAQLAPLLFALITAQPAAAQLPRSASAAAPAVDGAPAIVVIGEAGSAAPLALRASHVEVRIAGRSARVRTTLTYRNDGAVPVEALYTVPLPAALATLHQPQDEAAPGGCDEPYELAQFAEAGEAQPVYERGSLLVAPGEEVTVRLDRVTDLLVRGDRHRLVLPLTTQRGGVFTPQFSASVTIDAGRPVTALASATHAAEVDGLGTPQARLLVPAGRVYEGQFLALDYTLGDDAPAQAVAHAWGGEAHARALAARPVAAR